MKSDMRTPRRRVRFSITQLFLVICVCGLVAGWLQDRQQTRLMRQREDILINQMRVLQQENRELLLQVNRQVDARESDPFSRH